MYHHPQVFLIVQSSPKQSENIHHRHYRGRNQLAHKHTGQWSEWCHRNLSHPQQTCNMCVFKVVFVKLHVWATYHTFFISKYHREIACHVINVDLCVVALNIKNFFHIVYKTQNAYQGLTIIVGFFADSKIQSTSLHSGQYLCWFNDMTWPLALHRLPDWLKSSVYRYSAKATLHLGRLPFMLFLWCGNGNVKMSSIILWLRLDDNYMHAWILRLLV